MKLFFMARNVALGAGFRDHPEIGFGIMGRGCVRFLSGLSAAESSVLSERSAMPLDVADYADMAAIDVVGGLRGVV